MSLQVKPSQNSLIFFLFSFFLKNNIIFLRKKQKNLIDLEIYDLSRVEVKNYSIINKRTIIEIKSLLHANHYI
jgi:phage antirepressor YoqD-like protein